MSHRETCPDPDDARREGERAQEHGVSRLRNPYSSPYGFEPQCEEAADAWHSGYRHAERQQEERQAEEYERERHEAAIAAERQEESDGDY